MQHHKYSLTEMKYDAVEREIYLGLLTEWIKEENKE